MDLDSLKYGELQRLAKSVGLKANRKAEKLLEALKQHFEQKESSENANEADAPAVVEVSSSNVTKRRKKSQSVKRKLSGQSSLDTEPKVEASPGEDNAAVNDNEGGKSSSKRRKVSSAKDTETPASSENLLENQEEAKPASDNVSQRPDQGVEKKTAGRIPRHAGLLKKKAPTTPNFKKLHEAHFNKMESIDSYVQRKNKQMDALRSSNKELKAQFENLSKKPGDAKIQAKPPVGRAPLFSPGLQERKSTSEKRKFTPVLVNRSAAKDSVPFKPAVLSVNKINVRFSAATQDNEYKRSLVKTPARMSPMVPLTPTPGRKSDVRTKPEVTKSAAPVNKTPGVTPFVFTGTSTTPSTNKKNPFDLKASLSRPLTYKPHTGKLKPFVEAKENAALNKSQTIPSHQKNYKQHQVQTREDRRIKHTEGRKQKKETILHARRGLALN